MYTKLLPKDLNDLTENQIKEIIEYLSKFPLKKLRKHQELAEIQIKLAYINKDDVVLNNMKIRHNQLIRAISLKTFGFY